MKKLTSKITLIASMLAVACMFTAPALRAADMTKEEKQAKKKADDLKKYDKNKNGKIDDGPEKEAMEKDVAEAKAKKKKKKDGGN